MLIQRTVRVPLRRPDDEQWKTLRDAAAKAAVFANRAIADLCQAGWNGETGEALRATYRQSYGRMADELSGWVRSAMIQNRVRPYWKRSGRLVLKGMERAACFSANRALTISGDQVNNCGALYERDGDAYVLALRVAPVEIRDSDGTLVGRREPVRLWLAMESQSVRKDRLLPEAVDAIWSGAWRPGTVTLRFDVRRRTVDAIISYARPRGEDDGDGRGATLGPYNPETQELWLRFDREGVPSVNFAHRIHHMMEMKTHHEGLTHRLRRRMGKAKGRARSYKRRLRQIGDFSSWARDRMHELSRDIVARLRAERVTELRLAALGEGDLPWHALRQQLAYKSEDAGIRMVAPSAVQPATTRAEQARIAKTSRQLVTAKRGAQAMRELVEGAGRSNANHRTA